jgi:hypothetical protein
MLLHENYNDKCSVEKKNIVIVGLEGLGAKMNCGGKTPASDNELVVITNWGNLSRRMSKTME